jgi:Tn3 transposase DDE domain
VDRQHVGFEATASAKCACRDYTVAARTSYKDIRGKIGTLYGFKHPSQYDKESLLKPASEANTKLILAEEVDIQHILASLALKVTRQSVIIAKLSPSFSTRGVGDP